MKYDRLYNFISPVTGKLPIDSGYILLGDKDGKSYSSPVLIDVRQGIIDLKRALGNFEKLKPNHIWVGNNNYKPIEQLHIGIVNLPPLAEALFPNPVSGITGDFRIPNPTFDYSSLFDWVMSGPFLPQIYATKYDLQGNPIGTDISSSLAMTQVRAAQIMKRFDNADFIVGSSTVTFGWENPKMYLIPETLKQLYGLGTAYTFTKAQSLGNLETGLLKNTVADGKGTLSQAISGVDYVNTADFQIGYPVIIDPLYPAPGSKLIAPMLSFTYRKNKDNEFQPVANTIDIFEGLAAKFTQLAITGIAAGSLLRLNEQGEVIRAIPDIDYVQTITLQEYYNNIANYVNNIINDINNIVSDFTNDIINFFNENTNEILLTIAAATAAATITSQTSATAAEASAVTSTAAAADAKVSAIEATSSASAAASSAASAASSASAASAAVSAAVVASIFSGELGSAVSDARDAADDADDARDSAKDARDDARRALADLQDQPILVQGDVQGSGIIRTGILDANFSENPVFQGTHMIIPGVMQVRPLTKSPGMLRFNQNL